LRDDDDRLGRVEYRACPCSVLAAETDVDAAGEMRGRELSRIARVENLRTRALRGKQLIERQWLELACQRLIERGPLAAVQHRVVGEVRGCLGLVGRDEVDERRLAHGTQRVVGAPLVANGRDRVLRQRLAAQRAGTVRRVHQGGVWKREQFAMKRVEQHAAEVDRRPAERRAEIRTSDVAHKQRVARQDRRRRRGARDRVVHDKGNRFRRVPGRLQRLDAHVAEIDDAAIANRRERVFGVGGATQIDSGAGAVTQLEVAGNEISVEVGQKDMADAQAVIRSERQVLIDVALRIDYRGQATPLVANKVRGVRQAVEIELSQDHWRARVAIV